MVNDSRGTFAALVHADDLAAIEASGEIRSLSAGRPLFRQGERSDHVALIRSGRLEIVVASPDGHQTVVATRGPGELIGEFAALDGHPRSAAAVPVEGAEVVVVTARRFEQLLSQRAGMALALLRTVVSRLRESDRQRAEFGSTTAAVRLAQHLEDLVARVGVRSPDSSAVTVPKSQDDLASDLGISRDTVAKVLQRWRADGVILTGRGSVIVLDPDRLAGYSRL